MDVLSEHTRVTAQRRKVLANGASVVAMLRHGACMVRSGHKLGYGVDPATNLKEVKMVHAYTEDGKKVFDTSRTAAQ